MSQFSNRDKDESKSPARSPKTQNQHQNQNQHQHQNFAKTESAGAVQAPEATAAPPRGYGDSPLRIQRARASSRPTSMAYQPPLMDVNQDTLPELQPIFTFLNSHANKLYQEGYFLKLDDQNTQGKPNPDRTWTECFAQLVGTVLSLWDAADLDAAGQEGEVVPKFINLTDASIKMIESLQTRSATEAPLQNVLSISTAGKNRYLLHFNSHHSLIQWTAGIRLAMFEHAGLQEAYTGALIAGKGKALNNINSIMEHQKLKTEDWARVRFGAGTPWRRCWCVISPPDEKEVQKLNKQLNKKKSAYDRSRPMVLKGDIKFYDTRKTKKTRPIATITNVYAGFAIYPQSKPLIDASTLVKIEGAITIHSNPPLTSEGFVFVMPEVHPAVTGFEMLLRWLFPVFDTFGLYGRPDRLIADTANVNSLMFAMPKKRRYGYLEIIDVTALILESGSADWPESQWRARMKQLTVKRMTAIENGSRTNSIFSSRRSRNSVGPVRTRIQFNDDGMSLRSSPSLTWGPADVMPAAGIPRTDSAPPGAAGFGQKNQQAHTRSVSDTHGFADQNQSALYSSYDGSFDNSLASHGVAQSAREGSGLRYKQEFPPTPEREDSEDDQSVIETPVRELRDLQATTVPEPVAAPPAFSHAPGALPISKPYQAPEARRANGRMSNATLTQLAASGAAAAFRAQQERGTMSEGQQQSNPNVRNQQGVTYESAANQNSPYEGLVASRTPSPGQKYSRQTPSNNSSVSSFSHMAPGNALPPVPPRHSPLSTIPASPLYQPTISRDSTQYVDTSPSRLQTSPSILRKPVSSGSGRPVTSTSSHTVSSLGSLGFVDPDALDMVMQRNDSFQSTQAPNMNPKGVQRRATTASSVYDDDDVSSVDYASTIRSSELPKPIDRSDRPRAGVLKSVGDSTLGDSAIRTELPDVNFGPTPSLAALNRVPSPALNESYTPAATFQSNSASNAARNSMIANYQTNSAAKAVPWQPMTGAPSQAKQGLTAEQFVQQRAAVAASTPQYAHQRQKSSGNMDRANMTTSFRNRSSELLEHIKPNNIRRNSSGMTLGLAALGSGDMPTNLTAREQEHVARVTGTPLINLTQKNNRPSTSSGLIGHIDSRERDKHLSKQGYSSQVVAQAIAQRQQQGAYQHYPDQTRQSFYGTHPQQQHRQSWAPQSGSVFTQSPGWVAPAQSPGWMPPAHSPGHSLQQQQQYFTQQPPGGQARSSGYFG